MADAEIIQLFPQGLAAALDVGPLSESVAGSSAAARPAIRAADAPTGAATVTATDAPTSAATGAATDGVALIASVISSWERRAGSVLSFVRRRVRGDYLLDEYGFDPELAEAAILPLARAVSRGWFRTEATGVEQLPDFGPAVVAANHAGALWPLDAVMTAAAVHSETADHRFLRMLGADLVFDAPVLGSLARKAGATANRRSDAVRLLESGELVGVWPEGFRGIGKPYRERYQLQSFGRGGFVTAALRAGAPIVPTSIVGSEEIHPKLGEAPIVAKLLGLPYFPLTPTFPWLGPLGLIPLPSKWFIDFGQPIETARYGPEGADDRLLVSELTDRVRRQVQSGVDRRLAGRRTPWF
jgi:1-acyl-sn-glycerol-3-phosphate acyltransferase